MQVDAGGVEVDRSRRRLAEVLAKGGRLSELRLRAADGEESDDGCRADDLATANESRYLGGSSSASTSERSTLHERTRVSVIVTSVYRCGIDHPSKLMTPWSARNCGRLGLKAPGPTA